METIIQELHAQVKTFKEQPVYTVQVNKTGCRLIIEMKDNIDYGFFENNGESMNLPLNLFITNSGMQTATIKIFPKTGDSIISKYAMVNLVFYNAPNKDSNMDAYKEIAKFELPKDLEAKKLPYYEAKVTFPASVPWDYRKDIEHAADLTKLPDIEKKLTGKYNQIIGLLNKFDKVSYEREVMHFTKRVFETSYETSLEEIRKSENDTIAILDPRIEQRSFSPIANYTIRYYANGKIAALWDKETMEGMVRVKGKIKTKDGYRDYVAGNPLFLYLPEGSTELKVW